MDFRIPLVIFLILLLTIAGSFISTYLPMVLDPISNAKASAITIQANTNADLEVSRQARLFHQEALDFQMQQQMISDNAPLLIAVGTVCFIALCMCVVFIAYLNHKQKMAYILEPPIRVINLKAPEIAFRELTVSAKRNPIQVRHDQEVYGHYEDR